MNLKTLILVLCITLISSHPVKEENNDIYDYGDFDETETVTQNDIIASALTLNMTTSEKMTKTAEEITTATTTEEITTTTEKMTTTTEKMTTTTEKMTTTTEKEDLCKDNLCNENQVCTPNSFDYECDCRPGYIGHNCNRYDACFDVTCLNNGMKNLFDGKCECVCLHGSTGKFCENKIEITTTPEPVETTTEGEPEPEELDLDRREANVMETKPKDASGSASKLNTSNYLITLFSLAVLLISNY